MSRTLQCGRCGHSIDEAAWRRLELVERLEPARNVVVAWPRGRFIEIRRCSRCGVTMARKSRETEST